MLPQFRFGLESADKVWVGDSIPSSRAETQSADPSVILRGILAEVSPASRWAPVSAWELILFIAGVGGFIGVVRMSEPGFIVLLDHANLLFHEAGHPITGLFSQRLEPYGGTVGQLFFPGLLMVSFWRKGRPLALAVAMIWFSENFLNIARYMADARKLDLPLVGGGDHDWNTIFARWNVLQLDDRIAAGVNAAGWLGVGCAVMWVLWRAWTDRKARG